MREGSTPKIWIHDLVQYLIQYGVTTHVERKFWAEQATKVISNAFDEVSDPESHHEWATCELYMPHVAAVMANAEKWKINSIELFITVKRYALYLASRGRYKEGVTMSTGASYGRGYAKWT